MKTPPQLTPAQAAQIAGQVAAYIEAQREKFAPGAVSLTETQKSAVRPFFPADIVESVRLHVLSAGRVPDPPFYPQLVAMGFHRLPPFSLMASITLIDVVVSRERFTSQLLFHELVHAVQYRKLALKQFAALYVQGFLNGGSYEAIPLEMHAYHLDERFASGGKSFSVDSEVQQWIDSARY